MMLLTLVVVVAILLASLWRWGGAVRALLIAWLICLAPTALGIISYDYLIFTGDGYLLVIISSIAAFLAGAALIQVRPPEAGGRVSLAAAPIVDFEKDNAKWHRIGNACLAIAAISIITTGINIISSGLDLSDLASVRADAIDMTGANIWARIASVTAWACFLCLGLGIYFRTQMGPARAMLFVAAGSGIFLAMLSLAGRNSVLQLILFCLVIESVRTARLRVGGEGKSSSLSTRLAVGGAGFFYLLFITLNRPGDTGVSDRNALLLRLFNANLNTTLDSILNYVPFLKAPIVEFVIYVTHTAPLFAISMEVDFEQHFYGMFTFPFLARQLEPLFGHSVAGALDLKRVYIQSAGVIGFGWTTALSSFIMDFGYLGMMVVMFVQGMAGQYIFRQVKNGGGFGFVLMYVLMIISAAFTPFLPSFSDTNLFLLMVALLLFTYLLRQNAASHRP